jgi:hypothetical protein
MATERFTFEQEASGRLEIAVEPARERLRHNQRRSAEGATLPGTSQAKGPRGPGTSGKQDMVAVSF